MDLDSILSTVQPFVIMFAALLAAFMTAVWISLVIWTFRDIRARSRDVFAQILATLMVLIFFPLFPFPGLVLYMLLRPRETLSEIYERSLEEEALLQGIEERLACPGCNRRIQEDFMICPTCHTRLKKACPACGQLLHLRWNICPYCGAVHTGTRTAAHLAPSSVAMPIEPAVEEAMLPGTAPSRLLGPEQHEEPSYYEEAWPAAEEDRDTLETKLESAFEYEQEATDSGSEPAFETEPEAAPVETELESAKPEQLPLESEPPGEDESGIGAQEETLPFELD